MKKRYLFSLCCFSFILCCISSCSSDDEIVPDKKYRLAEVLWKIEESDTLQIIKQEVPEKEFRNTGSGHKEVTINLLEEMKETSYFLCNDMETLNKWTSEDDLISLPSEFSLLKTSYSYFMGGREAPLVAGEEFSLEPTTKMQDMTALPPNSMLTYQATIYMKKITATFRAILAEDGEGYDRIEIEGRWTGVFFNNLESGAVFSDIE